MIVPWSSPCAAALWTCTLIALPAALRAQVPPADVLERGQRSLGMWAGASLSSAAVFGRITDRRLFLSGLRLEYVLESIGAVTTTYTMDLHPLAVVTNTPRYGLQQIRDRDGTFVTYLVETGRSPVIGAGASPVGMQLYSRPLGGARLFAGGSAGAIWFNRDMPVAGARRFNFALQLGGGAEVAAGNGSVLVLGYKFHHLSNAGTARANPGMDGHVFHVGVMRRRRAAAGRGELAGQ